MHKLRDGHQVRLLQGGTEFFPALVQEIDASVHEVRLETYIFCLDDAGVQVASALVRAAQRGVAVYLVVDGAGTPSLDRQWAAQFDAAGVQWRIFAFGAVGWFWPTRWRRLHRKLCAIDGATVFCGGINVLDDLNDPNHGALQAPRFDFAVRVTGPLVAEVVDTMTRFWWRLRAARDVRRVELPAAWAALQASVQPAGLSDARAGTVAPQDPGHAGGGVRAGLLLRDNLRNRRRIELAYRRAIGAAREEIIIASAYFLPGVRLHRALLHAARRGVRVRLLLQGRYEYFMQFHAARPMYAALLGAGAEIHEYAPSFLHAKVAVIDGHWATIGSSNLDPLSLLLAREANVVVEDRAFAQELRACLEQAMQADGNLVDSASCRDRPWRHRLLDSVAFGLMRMMLFLSRNSY